LKVKSALLAMLPNEELQTDSLSPSSVQQISLNVAEKPDGTKENLLCLLSF